MLAKQQQSALRISILIQIYHLVIGHSNRRKIGAQVCLVNFTFGPSIFIREPFARISDQTMQIILRNLIYGACSALDIDAGSMDVGGLKKEIEVSTNSTC